jgi:hypothetical protein
MDFIDDSVFFLVLVYIILARNVLDVDVGHVDVCNCIPHGGTGRKQVMQKSGNQHGFCEWYGKDETVGLSAQQKILNQKPSLMDQNQGSFFKFWPRNSN